MPRPDSATQMWLNGVRTACLAAHGRHQCLAVGCDLVLVRTPVAHSAVVVKLKVPAQAEPATVSPAASTAVVQTKRNAEDLIVFFIFPSLVFVDREQDKNSDKEQSRNHNIHTCLFYCKKRSEFKKTKLYTFYTVKKIIDQIIFCPNKRIRILQDKSTQNRILKHLIN